MGYRLVNTDHLGIIWSQRTLGESNRSIARRLGLDRGTVNRYAEAIDALAIPPDTPLAEVRSRLSVLGSVNAKGKPARAVLEPLEVERIVPVVRELWKRLTALHPAASLEELNELARAWARDDYGKRCHGTTGAAPVAAFEDVERALLAPLPPEPFEPASWTVAKVNPDQFIRVGKRLYGLPALYIGKRVAVRSTDTLVEIYFEHKLVRSYPVTDALKSYLPQDFPAHGQPFVPGAYARSLIVKAREISPQAAEYLRLMLKGGGNLSLRRAQACLSVLQSRKDCPALSHVLGYAIAHQVFKPDALKVLFEDESRQRTLPFPISPCGAAMGRDVGYYVGP